MLTPAAQSRTPTPNYTLIQKSTPLRLTCRVGVVRRDSKRRAFFRQNICGTRAAARAIIIEHVRCAARRPGGRPLVDVRFVSCLRKAIYTSCSMSRLASVSDSVTHTLRNSRYPRLRSCRARHTCIDNRRRAARTRRRRAHVLSRRTPRSFGPALRPSPVCSAVMRLLRTFACPHPERNMVERRARMQPSCVPSSKHLKSLLPPPGPPMVGPPQGCGQRRGHRVRDQRRRALLDGTSS